MMNPMNTARFAILAALALASASFCDGGVVVVGKLARSNAVQPGEAFQGTILLMNTDSRPATARVYQTDYLYYADGTNAYGEPGTAARSNANWLTISPTRLRIGAGETVSVRYKGVAPTEPRAAGSFWSMIMVEPGAESAADPAEAGLRTKIRFGIQIVTEIGQATASLKVLDKRLAQGENGRALELDIENDGERLLIPAVTVELFDGNGASVGFFETGASRIYPGCSVRKKVDLSAVPAGKYAAMVLLDSGDLQVMGARYDLVLSP